MSDKVRTIVLFLVTGGWLFNLVAPVFVHSYTSSLAANAPLMLVLGALYATKGTKP